MADRDDRARAPDAQRPETPRRPAQPRRFDRKRIQKPLRYGLFARISDWRQAGHDAKAGLPRVQPDGDAVTQHLSVLERMARLASAREREKYEAECAVQRTVLARNYASRQVLARNFEVAKAFLAEVAIPLTDDELSRRRPGDEPISQGLVRERRMREHVRRINQARGQLYNAETALHRAKVEAAELCAEITARRDVAKAAVERVHEHVRRRRAAYWRRLVRRHPDGDRINSLLKPDWPGLPDWLDEPIDDSYAPEDPFDKDQES